MSHARRVVAVTGASGLIGRALCRRLAAEDVAVLRMVRHAPASDDEIRWCTEAPIDPDPRLDGLDAVVHLAGANVARRRWSRTRKLTLRTSRVDATAALVGTLARLDQPPSAFIQASATGIYGDRGDEVLDESSTQGEGFLAALAQDWEHAGSGAADHGMRWAALRYGAVLDGHDGALAKMLTPFKLGVAGRLGSGHQWMPWISLEDAVSAMVMALSDTVRGPMLAVAPEQVTNRMFTRALARALGRPAVVPAPSAALRLLLGEMADALLLSSQRCQPTLLTSRGFTWRHPTLDACLDDLLG